MVCVKNCKLCDRIIISNGVTFANGNLIINVPQRSYGNGCGYCLVVAQSIPKETTIAAPVYITIGEGAELYPLDKKNCTQATACTIRTRTKYSVVVRTNATGGVFRLTCGVPCAPDYALDSLPVAPQPGGGVTP